MFFSETKISVLPVAHPSIRCKGMRGLEHHACIARIIMGYASAFDRDHLTLLNCLFAGGVQASHSVREPLSTSRSMPALRMRPQMSRNEACSIGANGATPENLTARNESGVTDGSGRPPADDFYMSSTQMSYMSGVTFIQRFDHKLSMCVYKFNFRACKAKICWHPLILST